MMDSKMFNALALLLLVIGGLNWGLVGLLQLDLVTMLFGASPVVVNVVYMAVGLSALYIAVTMLPKMSKMKL